MKTLKVFRLLSMIAGLVCFMIYCLPEANGEAGYDWMMIAVLVLFMVIGPASLIGNIKRGKILRRLPNIRKAMSSCASSCLSLCLAYALQVS